MQLTMKSKFLHVLLVLAMCLMLVSSVVPVGANEVTQILTVDVTAPATANQGDTYEVSAEIDNIGTDNATGVIAVLTVSGNAVIATGANPRLVGAIDAVDPGSQTVSWWLTATGGGDVHLRVDVSSDNSTSGSDHVVVAQTATAPDINPLVVTITDPTSHVHEGQEFVVTSAIYNPSQEDVYGVKAVIHVDDNATWVSGGEAALSDHAQYIDRIEAGETWTVSWTYVCTAADADADFIVSARINDFGGAEDVVSDFNSDDLTVEQEDARFHVDITSPEWHQVMVENQNYTVSATITSTGENCDAEAYISFEEDNAVWVSGGDETEEGYPIELGDMVDGQTVTVSWVLRSAADDSSMRIEVGVESIETIAANDEYDDCVRIEQITPDHPLLNVEVEGPAGVISHSDSAAYVGQSFCIHGFVTNEGEEPALNVTATLTMDAGAAFVTGESATKTLGTIPAGMTYPVQWTVKCTAVGSTIFTVTANGLDDITFEPIADHGHATVRQIERKDISVMITHPENVSGDPQYGPAADSDLYLEFIVTNEGYTELTDVVANLEITGNATWNDGGDHVDGTSKTGHHIHVADSLAPGASVSITRVPNPLADNETAWLLNCTGEDNATAQIWTNLAVNVTAESVSCDCVAEASDDVDIWQKYLHVNIYQPSDEEFCVGADIIVNATALNAVLNTLGNSMASISWTGPVYLVSGWGSSISLGAITSGSTADTAATTQGGWHLECYDSGTVVITVTVSGIGPGNLTYTNHDTYTFEIVEDPAIEVTLDGPADGTYYLLGDSFEVTGIVTNTGCTSLDNITVTLTESDDFAWDVVTIDGGNPEDVGHLAIGAHRHVTWEVTATAVCEADFHADVTASSVCDSVSDASNSLSVNVIDLDIDVDALTADNEPDDLDDIMPFSPDGQVDFIVQTGETFSIDATLTNDDNDTLCPCVIEDVTAHIDICGYASLVPGESDTKTVGDLYDDIVDEDGDSTGGKAQWTVVCDRPGFVMITVTAIVTINGQELTVNSHDFIIQVPSHTSYEIPLAKDWNYMSLPIIPDSTDIEAVLFDIEGQYNQVWSYQNGVWTVFIPGAADSLYTAMGITKLTTMEPGLGYIIRMIYPDIVRGQGYEMGTSAVDLPPTYDLNAGWNLIGFKTMDFDKVAGEAGAITQAHDSMRVGYYLNTIDTNYNGVIITQEARFLRYLEPGMGWQELHDNDAMWIGKGYWLYASTPNLVIVPPVVAE